MRTLLVDHRLIRQGRHGSHTTHVREVYRRKACGLNGAQVPPRPLHKERINLVTEQGLYRALHAGIAPTMEHERRLGTDEVRRVDAQGNLPAAHSGIGLHVALSFFVTPA